METSPSNICFFPTDIRFYLASWYYANGLPMSVYGCLQMLNGLVSSHPPKLSWFYISVRPFWLPLTSTRRSTTRRPTTARRSSPRANPSFYVLCQASSDCLIPTTTTKARRKVRPGTTCQRWTWYQNYITLFFTSGEAKHARGFCHPGKPFQRSLIIGPTLVEPVLWGKLLWPEL